MLFSQLGIDERPGVHSPRILASQKRRFAICGKFFFSSLVKSTHPGREEWTRLGGFLRFLNLGFVMVRTSAGLAMVCVALLGIYVMQATPLSSSLFMVSFLLRRKLPITIYLHKVEIHVISDRFCAIPAAFRWKNAPLPYC